MKKWQRRWKISEKGRDLFHFKPKVKLKHIRTVFQLKSDYTELREYQHKVALADEMYCECGEVENPDHYILQCQNYFVHREKLRQDITEI